MTALAALGGITVSILIGLGVAWIITNITIKKGKD